MHQEDLAEHPDGLRRSAFCARYRAWKKARGVVMRQSQIAGDKLFVDYSGDKAYYVDAAMGQRIACELFVATLGTSSYTFAEATHSQKTPDFLASYMPLEMHLRVARKNLGELGHDMSVGGRLGARRYPICLVAAGDVRTTLCQVDAGNSVSTHEAHPRT